MEKTPATIAYRLTFEDGRFIEKEYIAGDDIDLDAYKACMDMALHAPQNFTESPIDIKIIGISNNCQGHFCIPVIFIAREQLGFDLDNLTDESIQELYNEFRNNPQHNGAPQRGRVIERFQNCMTSRGLHPYVAELLLRGENGASDEYDGKPIWARSQSEAEEQAKEWAAERREETGEPWEVSYTKDHWGDWYHPKTSSKNILDTALPAASDELPKLKLPQLCNLAIEIMSEPLPEPGKKQVKRFLRRINLEIFERVNTWAAYTFAAAVGSGAGISALIMRLTGGVMLKSSEIAIWALTALGVLIISAVIFNKQVIAVKNWAATMAANLAARRRGKLEQKADIHAERCCGDCARLRKGYGSSRWEDYRCKLDGKAKPFDHRCDCWKAWKG